MRGSAAAWLIAVAICAGLYSVSWHPLSVHAALAPGTIITEAGSVGSGPPTSVGRGPLSLAFTSTGHLYIGDNNNPVVRDFDTVGGTETVLAGNNGYGYTGDGGPATSAMINTAGAIVNCGPGLTFFADSPNNVIRKIDGSGVITKVAGNGTPGYSGDGGPGTSAQVNNPYGLACRTGGGLYIADTNNGVIRILDAAGNITTWWSGFFSPWGIVELGSQNLVNVSEAGFNAVWQLTDSSATVIAGSPTGTAGSSGDNGVATSALLKTPTGLAYDAANQELYIADTGNNEVRRVAFGVIIKLAGQAPPAAPGFGGDGGTPTLATLNQPVALALTGGRSGGFDTFYVADSLNYRVRKIDTTGGQNFIITVAGNGTPSWSGDGGQASLAQLGNPFGVAFDGAGNEYIADNQDNVIRKITPAGVISTVAGNAKAKPGFSGDGFQAIAAQLNDPRGLAVTAAGDIAIADTGNQRVRLVTAAGIITTIAGNGTAGNNGGMGSPATSFELNYPRGVAIDAAGNVYIADTNNERVLKVAGGALTTIAGTGGTGFQGDGSPAIGAVFNGPRGLAFDGSGNLFISDANNNRVRRVAAAGGIITISSIITTVAGNGTARLAGDLNLATGAALNHPFGLAVDAAGRLYIADTGNQRIRLVDTSGIISSVVATCGVTAGFSGDNGQASLAQLNSPFGIAVSAAGDLYIADVNNNRVRQAFGLPGVRASSCQSTAAPAQTSRGASQSTGVLPPGPRIPWIDRPAAGPTGLPTVPRIVATTPLRTDPAGPPAAAAVPAAAPLAAVPQAVAPPVAAAPAAVPSVFAPEVEAAPAVNSREVAVVAASRNPAVSRNESGPAYGPAVLIPLALISLALLGVRRRERRLNSHKGSWR